MEIEADDGVPFPVDQHEEMELYNKLCKWCELRRKTLESFKLKKAAEDVHNNLQMELADLTEDILKGAEMS